jgi:hypothetical protein
VINYVNPPFFFSSRWSQFGYAPPQKNTTTNNNDNNNTRDVVNEAVDYASNQAWGLKTNTWYYLLD